MFALYYLLVPLVHAIKIMHLSCIGRTQVVRRTPTAHGKVSVVLGLASFGMLHLFSEQIVYALARLHMCADSNNLTTLVYWTRVQWSKVVRLLLACRLIWSCSVRITLRSIFFSLSHLYNNASFILKSKVSHRCWIWDWCILQFDSMLSTDFYYVTY